MKRSFFHASLALALMLGCAGTLSAEAQQAAHSAITPAPREDDWWQGRHASMNARVQKGNAGLLFIGDSITQGWEGAGSEVWQTYYADRNAVNLGISGDRTQHVLWRLENGNLENISPRAAVVMIGTNNWRDNTDSEIAEGIAAIVDTLRGRFPEMKILLLAVFPRSDVPISYQERLRTVNRQIAALDDGATVLFRDIGRWFLNDRGDLPRSIMPDLLHPNTKGYWRWARAIEPMIADMLGEYGADTPPKGFVPLFNGKDLSGWRGLVENPKARAAMRQSSLARQQAEADELLRKHWRVEDGILHFDGEGSHACTKRWYEDFELLLDWRIEEHGDSGIYLRGTPQVQIWDPVEAAPGSGGLYNNERGPNVPLVCADNAVGEWNRFRILMQGEKVTVWLNDAIVVDNTRLENYWDRDEALYPSEQIELQSHHTPLWFKNVFIREIPRGKRWKPLFNGQDLAGWEQVGGEKSTWGAENGLLYTDGEGGGWLSTVEEFDDFELVLEFRVPPGGNSGVFIRARREGNPAFEGSEIQILDDYAGVYKNLDPWQYCGSLYATVAPSDRVSLQANEWQKLFVRAKGPEVAVRLNGHPIIDADLNDHDHKKKDHPGLTRRGGHIGLQNHGSRLEFRNLLLRPL